MAKMITLRAQLTATIRDQTEVILSLIHISMVNVMVIVTGETKEEAIGEIKMNIGPR